MQPKVPTEFTSHVNSTLLPSVEAVGGEVVSRPPYHTTPSGLHRTHVTHPLTGVRLTLSDHSLPKLMARRERLIELRREYLLSCACPHCGGELVAERSPSELAAAMNAATSQNPKSPMRARTTIAAAWRRYEDDSPLEHRRKLRSVFKHQIEPFLTPQTRTLASLDEFVMDRWLRAMRAEGYAKSTVHNAFFFLSACYRREARAKRVPREEPWGEFRAPSVDKIRRRRLLSMREVLAIARELGGARTQTGRCLVFASLTGLRNGELAGLGWDDIDLERGVMNVRHQAVDEWRKHYPRKLRPDFPVKGRREHAQRLHPQALALLVMQRRELAKAGAYRPDGPVWPDARGNWKRNATTLRSERLQRAAVRAGLSPKGIYAHALRHACTSWEIDGGNDLLSTQSRIGHASVRTTADTYAHPRHLPESRIPAFAWSELGNFSTQPTRAGATPRSVSAASSERPAAGGKPAADHVRAPD